MDVIELLLSGTPFALFFLAMGFPFGSNKKELDALTEEKEVLEKKGAKLESRLEEAKKKYDKSCSKLSALEEELNQLRTRNRELKDEAKKASRLQQQLNNHSESAAGMLERKDGLLKELQQELLSLKEENAALKEQLKNAPATPAPKAEPEPVVSPEPQETEPEVMKPSEAEAKLSARCERLQKSCSELKNELHSQKKENKKLRERNRTLTRMSEHNRRAYVVTLSQLDLAQDEAHLLKTGKPRRQTAQSQKQRPEEGQSTQTEDATQAPKPTEEADEPKTVDDLSDV